VNNKKCVCIANCNSVVNRELGPGSQDCGSAIIGGVEPPVAVQNINSASGGEIGLIFFLSRMIRFGTIVAGIFVIWNFVAAGFTYISSAGNADAHVKVRDKITWSVIGILVIVSAYTIAGIIGLVYFKDPTFILNPQIEGAI